MKVSTRLFVMVLAASLGLALLVAGALFALHTAMYQERQDAIRLMVQLAGEQVERFRARETRGELSREEAQARALEAVRGLRQGNDYVFVRSIPDQRMLAHIDPKREGQVDPGVRQADGRSTHQLYVDTLDAAGGSMAFVTLDTQNIATGRTEPKITGLQRIEGWDWIVGIGLYLGDIERAFTGYAVGLAVGGLVTLLVVAAIAWSMSRSIRRELGGEPAYAASVARRIADGDLRTEPDRGARPDSLIGAMSQMQGRLREMIHTIQHGAGTLAAASTALNDEVSRINEASAQSSEATASTAAAIEQMSVSVDHISANARDTQHSATESARVAADGERLISDVSREIQSVSTQISSSSTLVSELATRISEISGIANVIKDIAGQTNLLALNASIEAARAGEQGRGFAVVADQVRGLAERTAAATAQIDGTINRIQHDTDSVVGSMVAIVPQVGRSVGKADEAAAALQRISGASHTVLDNIRDVAHATAEQSAASASIASNVERIAGMVDASAVATRSARDNVDALDRLVSELRTSVARFRLE